MKAPVTLGLLTIILTVPALAGPGGEAKDLVYEEKSGRQGPVVCTDDTPDGRFKKMHLGESQRATPTTRGDNCSNLHKTPMKELGELHKTIIMGKDNRRALNRKELDLRIYEQVVQTLIEGGAGTGFVMGKNCDVLITSAHLSVDRQKVKNGTQTTEGKSTAVVFRPLYDGTLSAERIASGWSRDGKLLKERILANKQDWAIYRLNKPAYKTCEQVNIHSLSKQDLSGEKKSFIGWDGKTSEETQKIKRPLQAVGYHYGEKWEEYRKIEKTCSGYDVSFWQLENQFAHDCDTKGGSSGMPLFIRDSNGELSLVGIHGQYYYFQYNSRTGKNNFKFGSNNAPSYDPSKRVNIGYPIRGEFKRALEKELRRSEKRAAW